MDAIKVSQIADEIEAKIKLLEKGRDGLEERAINKADALGAYRKGIEIATITLRAEGVPVTLIKDLARGACSEQERNMDLAESMYKIQITKLDSIKAELNGKQSVFSKMEVRAV
jgi:hypothetical protein